MERKFLSSIKLKSRFLFNILVIFFWFLRIPRTTPSVNADRGMFAAAAERILAGDRLYVDVWFPKDPVFIWVISVGRFFSPLADIAIENMWLLLASYATYKIAKFFEMSHFISIFYGFLITPTILTGGNYYPGYTHLPGISLLLFAVAMALNNRFMISGFIISVTFFTKIMVIPLLIPLVAYSLFLSKSKKAARQLFIGISLGMMNVITILIVRGELTGYFSTVIWNFKYSGGDIYPNWIYPIAHILRASNSMSWSLIIVVLLILSLKYIQNKSNNLGKNYLQLGHLEYFTIISLFFSLCILALSGMWDHHNQILYIPGIFSMLLFAKYLQSNNLENKKMSLICGLLIAILLGGPKQGEVFVTFGEMNRKILDLKSIPAEASALRKISNSGSYSRLGTNGYGVNSFGLRKWKLACPYLEFYPKFASSFEEQQNRMLSCLPKSDYVVVSPEFQEWLMSNSSQNSVIWNSFILSINYILKNDFDCINYSEIMICSRVKSF